MSRRSDSAQAEKTDARRLVEASAWRARLTEQDLESSPEFEAWLAQDHRNRRAWDHVQSSWDFFGEHAIAPELLDLRRRALSEAREAGRRHWDKGWLAERWPRAAAAAALLAVLAGSLAVWNLQQAVVYRTEAGENRVVTLTDGSKVQLDAQTELRVKYSKLARDLLLVKGQARFDVARDVERPFAVLAAGQKVVALGTAFNIDLLGRDLFVTLIEGKIVVLPQNSATRATAVNSVETASVDAASAGSIELTSGQQLTLSADKAPKVTAANVQRTTAWQNGQLIFDDEPLSSVVARINRYADKPLGVSGEAAELKLSGVFNVGDVDGFVTTVTSYLPIEARKTAQTIQLRHR